MLVESYCPHWIIGATEIKNYVSGICCNKNIKEERNGIQNITPIGTSVILALAVIIPYLFSHAHVAFIFDIIYFACAAKVYLFHDTYMLSKSVHSRSDRKTGGSSFWILFMNF